MAGEMTKTTEPTTTPAELLERVVIGGDLAKLSTVERLQYYRAVCTSLGLNPLTQPFEYIVLKGRLRLYARRECTDQLRKLYDVSIAILARDYSGPLYTVLARATMPGGRADESLGVIWIEGLTGEDLANAVMKCETKAKRRATLSLCGLGMLDETEVESLPADVTAAPSPVDDARHALTSATTVPALRGAWERLTASAEWGSFTAAEQAALTAAKDTHYRRLTAPTKLDAALAGRVKPEPPDAVA
jgi:hypothetical protein